jgi:hypothetical protein
VRSADPFMNVSAAHAFVLVLWDLLLLSRLNGTLGGRQGLKVQARRRWCPARLEEDSAAAVNDRTAGFLRAARPLSMWLDTNVGRQPPGQSRVSRALWPQMRTA